MGEAIDKLLSISTTDLIPKSFDSDLPAVGGLDELLRRRNGFYAFENALHVFPVGTAAGVMDLERWNDENLWRHEYRGLTAGCLFFAEDAFAAQFCFKDGRIFRFEPETARFDDLAKDIEEWAALLLDDYAALTGWPFAHEWQALYGPLPTGKRLAPKLPFMLGGDYSPETLWACDPVERLRLAADLERQTARLPDGTRVRLVVDEGPALPFWQRLLRRH
jgi:hypothetical protein